MSLYTINGKKMILEGSKGYKFIEIHNDTNWIDNVEIQVICKLA